MASISSSKAEDHQVEYDSQDRKLASSHGSGNGNGSAAIAERVEESPTAATRSTVAGQKKEWVSSRFGVSKWYLSVIFASMQCVRRHLFLASQAHTFVYPLVYRLLFFESSRGVNLHRTFYINNVYNTTLWQTLLRYAVSVRWEREMEEAKAAGRKTPLCTGTARDLDAWFCCCARQIGGMFSLVEQTDGTPIVIAGPCWPFCTFITVPLIVVLSGLVSYFVVLNRDSGLVSRCQRCLGGSRRIVENNEVYCSWSIHVYSYRRFCIFNICPDTPCTCHTGFNNNAKNIQPWWFAFIYFPILAVTLLALFFVSCRDPGLLERVTDEEAGEGGWFWNEQVGSFRPPGAMYCRECKALIQDYDHLCPWTGTGVGKNNMLAFKVFVVMVNILCYTSIALVAFMLLSGIRWKWVVRLEAMCSFWNDQCSPEIDR